MAGHAGINLGVDHRSNFFPLATMINLNKQYLLKKKGKVWGMRAASPSAYPPPNLLR